MSSQVDPPSEIPPVGILSGERELEWLLCLASAFQACQRQELTQVDEASQRSFPLQLVAAAVRTWTFWPRWRAGLRQRR